MSELFDPKNPLNSDFRNALATELSTFIDSQGALMTQMGLELGEMYKVAAHFSAGGKRVRPAFCAWGYIAAGEVPADPVALLRVGASLDLLHVSALVHDDVMDASATRRGIPAAHHQFAAQHQSRSGLGDSDQFGMASAVLLGDLLIMWSAELYSSSGFEPTLLASSRTYLDAMRKEVTCGQYLDVFAQTHNPTRDEALELATRVVEYKSARYTVTRPVQIGAALAGAKKETVERLADFGSPLGRAFQYRDDILGIFGEPTITGKPAGDDIRDGKRTMLVAHAFAALCEADQTKLSQLLGKACITTEEIAQAAELIADSGAREKVEAEIERCLDEALTALDQTDLTPTGKAGLIKLAEFCVQRDS